MSKRTGKQLQPGDFELIDRIKERSLHAYNRDPERQAKRLAAAKAKYLSSHVAAVAEMSRPDKRKRVPPLRVTSRRSLR